MKCLIQESIWKYFQYPVVMQTSSIHLSQLSMPPPLIYICYITKFDYELAKEYGYSSVSNFLAGRLNGNRYPAFWTGKKKWQLCFKQPVKMYHLENF